MTTRRQLAAEIDRIDTELRALQADKKEIFAAYREEHGKIECRAAQAAIKLRQKYADGLREAIEEHEELVAEILAEIMPGTNDAIARSALRATRDPGSETDNGGPHEVEPIIDMSVVNAPGSLDAGSAATEEIADRVVGDGVTRSAEPHLSTSSPGTEADAAPASFSTADAKLISRVTTAKRKGIPANEAGDSARWQRLVKDGALILAAGRLYNPALAPEHEAA